MGSREPLRVWGEGHLQARACWVLPGDGGWVIIESHPGLWHCVPGGCRWSVDPLVPAETPSSLKAGPHSPSTAAQTPSSRDFR